MIAGSRGYFVPDDPKIIGTNIKPGKVKGHPTHSNFTKMREMKQFAVKSASVTLFIMEVIYGLILEDVKIKQQMSRLLDF